MKADTHRVTLKKNMSTHFSVICINYVYEN